MGVPSSRWTKSERLTIIGMLNRRLAGQKLKLGEMRTGSLADETAGNISILVDGSTKDLQRQRDKILFGLTL